MSGVCIVVRIEFQSIWHLTLNSRNFIKTYEIDLSNPFLEIYPHTWEEFRCTSENELYQRISL